MLGESVFLGLMIATFKNGNMRFLKYVDVRYFWLPIAAFLLEIASEIIVSQNLLGLRLFWNEYYLVVQIIIYTMLVIFCYYNMSRRIFVVILIGILLNFAVISFNDGKMPVDVEGALSEGYTVEVDQLSGGFIAGHDILDEETTRLKILGDVIHIPPPYPFPKTISIGDIAISAGVFFFISNTQKRRKTIVR
ncbi:MAG TPA: DUF5317 domain-containing protein [Clostridia bacterium]|nr:DUF5317 domain-containing protein [Clostridia bacterium]